MPLRTPSDRHYDGTTMYTDLVSYSKVATTDSSGNAIWYLTSDGSSTGAALFSNVVASSIQLTPWSNSLIVLTGVPTLSADFKTVTVAVKQNSSLLSLGLVPFTTAASGQAVSMFLMGTPA